MKHTIEERALRIVSGTAAEVEAELNVLLEAYVPTVWNFQPGANGALVSVVLVHSREIRKAQLAQMSMSPMVGVRGQ
jgi:hypothetical protein